MHLLDEIPVEDLASHDGLKIRVIRARLKDATEELRRVALRRRMSPRARAALAIVPFNAAVFLAPARGLPELPPGMADRIWGRLETEIRLDALRGLGGVQVLLVLRPSVPAARAGGGSSGRSGGAPRGGVS
jgi:hypothetical protein